MDAGVRHSILEKISMVSMDHACLKKKRKAAQVQVEDFAQVALEYLQTPHQQDDISGNNTGCSYFKQRERPILLLSNNPWIGVVVRKVNHPAKLYRHCNVDSRVRFDIFQSH